VKNVRYRTVLANQRMQASSKKRIRKLIRNRSRYRPRPCVRPAFSGSPFDGSVGIGSAVSDKRVRHYARTTRARLGTWLAGIRVRLQDRLNGCYVELPRLYRNSPPKRAIRRRPLGGCDRRDQTHTDFGLWAGAHASSPGKGILNSVGLLVMQRVRS
jgi:hypothetical protein